MIKITNPADCCGCTACASICSSGAIKMIPDTLGFLYPMVDDSKCIKCGLCVDVCSFNDHYDSSLNFDTPIVYAARHKNVEEIMRSRSGAVFPAVSDYILENNGIVYGAGYLDHFRVAHKRAVSKTERDEFRGSKYVQSDLRGIFSRVKQDLKNGSIVLFSGTPCQTSALNSFVGKRLRERLYLLDIVCHGTPGPYLWRDYIYYLERKNGKKITSVNFRNKDKFGWAAHVETFMYDTECKSESLYTYLFNRHISLRHSCGKCPFTNTKRPSDITLADYWGWEKTDVNFNKDNKGVSLVLVNTEKGNTLINTVSKDLNMLSVKLENCIQPNLKQPSIINPKRDLFEKDYKRWGFDYVIHRYGNVGVIYKVKTLIGIVIGCLNKMIR